MGEGDDELRVDTGDGAGASGLYSSISDKAGAETGAGDTVNDSGSFSAPTTSSFGGGVTTAFEEPFSLVFMAISLKESSNKIPRELSWYPSLQLSATSFAGRGGATIGFSSTFIMVPNVSSVTGDLVLSSVLISAGGGVIRAFGFSSILASAGRGGVITAFDSASDLASDGGEGVTIAFGFASVLP